MRSFCFCAFVLCFIFGAFHPSAATRVTYDSLGNAKTEKGKMSSDNLVIKPTGTHTHTVIWMHGLGDTGQGWYPVMQILAKSFPNVKFILPTAPKRPISLNGGFRMTGWFDIKHLDKNAAEDEAGVKQSQEIIGKIIEAEEGSVGSQNVFLGGFSQGAAMSLFTGLSYPKPLGGIVALSGWAVCGKTLLGQLHEANKATNVLMCHGEADQVVQFGWGKESFDHLHKARGGDLTVFKNYRGMGHSSSDEEIRDIASWFAARFGK